MTSTNQLNGVFDGTIDRRLLGRLRDRGQFYDGALLVAVPLLLIGVFLFPRETKRGLALVYTAPTLRTMVASHFVHLSQNHLLTNLIWYFSIVPLGYVLSVLSGRRWQFLIAFVSYLLAFPLVLSGLNILLVRPRIGFGFSGINMAFLGYLPMAMTRYFCFHFDTRLEIDHAPLFFFTGVTVIALWFVPISLMSGLAVGIALVAVVLYIRAVQQAGIVLSWRRLSAVAERQQYFALGILSLYLFILLPLTAFPRDPSSGTTILNLFTHLLGYCFGFITPYITFQLLETESFPLNDSEQAGR